MLRKRVSLVFFPFLGGGGCWFHFKHPLWLWKFLIFFHGCCSVKLLTSLKMCTYNWVRIFGVPLCVVYISAMMSLPFHVHNKPYCNNFLTLDPEQIPLLSDVLHARFRITRGPWTTPLTWGTFLRNKQFWAIKLWLYKQIA